LLQTDRQTRRGGKTIGEFLQIFITKAIRQIHAHTSKTLQIFYKNTIVNHLYT